MKTTVTYTELTTRLRCPYRGHLAYDLRWAPKVKSPGLREGTIADTGMNALYDHVRDTGIYDPEVMVRAMREAAHEESERIINLAPNMAPEDWEAMEERTELLIAVARRYCTWAQTNDDFIPLLTQVEGRVPVLGPKGHPSTLYDLIFKPDMIVEREGRCWIVENKWWKTLASDSLRMLRLDEQSGWYLWATRQWMATRPRELSPRMRKILDDLGLPVGVLYNVVRKALPRVPAQLKGKEATVVDEATGKKLKDAEGNFIKQYIPGETSRDKSIDTDHATYLATLRERGQDPADYAEILEALEGKGDSGWFYRDEIEYNKDGLAEIGQRIWALTRFRAPQLATIKHRKSSCTWECPFLPLCEEWSEEVLDAGYYKRERRHEEYETIKTEAEAAA
jgi:hypothetical protein